MKSLEPRMAWARKVLKHLTTFGPPAQWVRADLVFELLKICSEKHGSRPHRGAAEDIKHAHDHITKVRAANDLKLVDPETGYPHLIHAAADCLLAFGALMGLIDNTRGETLVGVPGEGDTSYPRESRLFDAHSRR